MLFQAGPQLVHLQMQAAQMLHFREQILLYVLFVADNLKDNFRDNLEQNKIQIL